MKGVPFAKLLSHPGRDIAIDKAHLGSSKRPILSVLTSNEPPPRGASNVRRPAIRDKKNWNSNGDLEKLLWLSVAGIFGVNRTESEGEQTGIIREEIQGG